MPVVFWTESKEVERKMKAGGRNCGETDQSRQQEKIGRDAGRGGDVCRGGGLLRWRERKGKMVWKR